MRTQAYVAMLRMQERLYSHKFYRRAAKVGAFKRL